MAKNWYIILELEFDPNPVHDLKAIEKRLDEKSKFWSSKFNDSSKGAEYRTYFDSIADIKKDMSDESTRKRLVKEACSIAYEPIDKRIKFVSRTKGNITDAEIQKIANLQKVSVDLVKRRVGELKIAIEADGSADYQKRYDEIYKKKPPNAAVFDQTKPLLKAFAPAGNLYEFLYADTTTKDPQNLPHDTLSKRAKDKKSKEFNKHDARSGSGQKLCGHCDLIFKDEPSKKVYDNYLEHNKRKTILDEVKDSSKITSKLSKDDCNEFIKQLTALSKDIKTSTEDFIAFCEIEGIIYGIEDDKSEKSAKKVVCRKGHINDVSDGRKVCFSCGEELYRIPCPKCGKINEATINVCSDGFDFIKLDKSNALCSLSEGLIDAMDFSTAEAQINDAESYWKENPRIELIRKRIKERKALIGSKPEDMRLAVEEGRYYAVKKHYDDIRKMFSEFRDMDLESEVKVALDSADEAMKKAKASKSEGDIIDYCDKAYESCKDYPGIQETIAKYPPKPPSNIEINVDEANQKNIIKWDKSLSDGMVHYTVIRKEDVSPVSVNDGKKLGRISLCEFVDTQIEPAINYFYAIFAERAGTQSKPLINKAPAINLFEVSTPTIVASDSSLEIQWGTFPIGAKVEIYKKNGSKEELIHSTTSTSYTDTSLVNENSYAYIIRLAYNIGGKIHKTKGISISGIPTQPPKPINILAIKPSGGDIFTATWENPDKADVEFYCSVKKPVFKIGDIVQLQAVEREMDKLTINKTSSCEATFKHKDNGLLYILVVTVKSGSAVIGTFARASKEESVKIQDIGTANGKIFIYLENIPSDAISFVVLYRHDRFPLDISEVDAKRRQIALRTYDVNKALVIEPLESQDYYFSVFVGFDRDGEKEYSIGTDRLFSNTAREVISYTIKVSWGNVIIDFKSNKGTLTLPDIDLMSCIGFAPTRRVNASLFHGISAQKVKSDILRIKIPIPKGTKKNTHIKLFLKDETLSSKYHLKPTERTNYKIS